MNPDIATQLKTTQGFLEQKELDRQTMINIMVDQFFEWTRQLGMKDHQAAVCSTENVGRWLHGNADKNSIVFKVAFKNGDVITLETKCALFWNALKNEWVWKEWYCDAERFCYWEECTKLSLVIPDGLKVFRSALELAEHLLAENLLDLGGES